ncbi:MAG: hypothetical protein KDD44_11530, partial [Bdellovibrionales bacterium]|nr:hypothetical protein [Bdellovibrionales bacterium]
MAPPYGIQGQVLGNEITEHSLAPGTLPKRSHRNARAAGNFLKRVQESIEMPLAASRRSLGEILRCVSAPS